MNQNNNTNQNSSNNPTNREVSKLITLTAFMIGYILIDNLNSNEQNALGNFFMLVGQTLSTSGSENFKRDWATFSNPTNNPQNGNFPPNNNGYYQSNYTNNSMSKEQAINMLNRARDVFNQEIDKLQ